MANSDTTVPRCQICGELLPLDYDIHICSKPSRIPKHAVLESVNWAPPDLTRIAAALERIAEALERTPTVEILEQCATIAEKISTHFHDAAPDPQEDMSDYVGERIAAAIRGLEME